MDIILHPLAAGLLVCMAIFLNNILDALMHAILVVLPVHVILTGFNERIHLIHVHVLYTAYNCIERG